MPTVIEIDDALARRATAVALGRGMTMAQLVEQAVTDTVDGRGDKVGSAATADFPTYGGDGIVDGLTLEQAIERADLADDLAMAIGIGRAAF